MSIPTFARNIRRVLKTKTGLCRALSQAPHTEVLEKYNNIGKFGKNWADSPDDFSSGEHYHQTQLPLDEAWTLTPKAYYDPKFAKTEMESVFSKSWVCVGHTSQLQNPGDMMNVEIGDQSILLVKNKEDEINAFYNVCRHRGSQLIDCATQKSQIVCPYHRWCYDLDGNLTAAPGFGENVTKGIRGVRKTLNFDTKKFHLIPIKVEVWGVFIFINRDQNSEPLRNQLGDLPERCKNYPLERAEIVRTRLYHANCNWKLLCENFIEWYHVDTVHPMLSGFSTSDNHEMIEPAGQYSTFRTYPLTNIDGPGDWDVFPSMKGLDDEEEVQGLFYHIYPNVSFGLMNHHLVSLIMLPDKDPAKSREHFTVLMCPENRNENDTDQEHSGKVDKLMKFWTDTNDEDIWICEKVQKGVVNSTYPGGRYSAPMEKCIHEFQNMIIASMTGTKFSHDAIQMSRNDGTEEIKEVDTQKIKSVA